MTVEPQVRSALESQWLANEVELLLIHEAQMNASVATDFRAASLPNPEALGARADALEAEQDAIEFELGKTPMAFG